MSGFTITFEIPVSSSRLKKTKPFAVPGRCRAITHPATRVYCPSGTRGKSHARFTCSLDRASRQYVIGCGPVLMPELQVKRACDLPRVRSEEHTSELQSH